MRRVLALATVVLLAVAPSAHAYVYWVPLFGAPAIGRANLDGSTINPRFLLVDASRGLVADGSHLFWGTDSGISRANPDGSDIHTNLIVGLIGTQQALDAKYIYTANTGSNSVGRANRDGTGVNQQFISGINING